MSESICQIVLAASLLSMLTTRASSRAMERIVAPLQI